MKVQGWRWSAGVLGFRLQNPARGRRGEIASGRDFPIIAYTTRATLRTTRWRCPSQESPSGAGRGCGSFKRPTPPAIQLRRVLVRDELWVVEGVIDYGGGQVFDVVLIISELKDGKMWRDRWYFAEPFEAPKWRAQWVERMES